MQDTTCQDVALSADRSHEVSTESPSSNRDCDCDCDRDRDCVLDGMQCERAVIGVLADRSTIEGAMPLANRSTTERAMMPRPVGTIGRRHAALAMLFRRVAATALSASLVACGGGGGGTDGNPPPPPSPAPSPAPTGPIAAVLSVPTPVGYDANRLAAFNRLNEIRLSAGLGMLAQNAMLDQAAQAHADWEIANNVLGHVEQPGTIGFTGTNWWLRDEALGYVPLGGTEVISAGAAAGAGVNGLVNAIYHRAGILAFGPVDVGIGWSSRTVSNVSMPLVIDITTPAGDPVRSLGQAAQASIEGVAIWPLDGAQGVWTHMGNEEPNPVPGIDVRTLGTPASITVASSKAISATTFAVTNVATGAVVPTATLANLSDFNFAVPPSFIAAIPLVPLDSNATYAVAFSGSIVAGPFGTPMAYSRTWRFSTGSD